MRTSLNEIKQVEEHLLGQTAPGEQLLFEAHLLLDEQLRSEVKAQQQAYALLREYGRIQLRREIAAIHEQLFTAPEHRSFRQKIHRLFFH